jgi:hypothetical protein
MSYCLTDIAAIINMDGFSVNGKFICKELGFLKVGDATAQSFFFDIGLRWRDLTPKDLRTPKSPLASKIKVKVTPTKGQIICVMRQMSWNKHVTRQQRSWNKHVMRQMSHDKCYKLNKLNFKQAPLIF